MLLGMNQKRQHRKNDKVYVKGPEEDENVKVGLPQYFENAETQTGTPPPLKTRELMKVPSMENFGEASKAGQEGSTEESNFDASLGPSSIFQFDVKTEDEDDGGDPAGFFLSLKQLRTIDSVYAFNFVKIALHKIQMGELDKEPELELPGPPSNPLSGPPAKYAPEEVKVIANNFNLALERRLKSVTSLELLEGSRPRSAGALPPLKSRPRSAEAFSPLKIAARLANLSSDSSTGPMTPRAHNDATQQITPRVYGELGTAMTPRVHNDATQQVTPRGYVPQPCESGTAMTPRTHTDTAQQFTPRGCSESGTAMTPRDAPELCESGTTTMTPRQSKDAGQQFTLGEDEAPGVPIMLPRPLSWGSKDCGVQTTKPSRGVDVGVQTRILRRGGQPNAPPSRGTDSEAQTDPQNTAVVTTATMQTDDVWQQREALLNELRGQMTLLKEMHAGEKKELNGQLNSLKSVLVQADGTENSKEINQQYIGQVSQEEPVALSDLDVEGHTRAPHREVGTDAGTATTPRLLIDATQQTEGTQLDGVEQGGATAEGVVGPGTGGTDATHRVQSEEMVQSQSQGSLAFNKDGVPRQMISSQSVAVLGDKFGVADMMQAMEGHFVIDTSNER
jgi:hypothetical protein